MEDFEVELQELLEEGVNTKKLLAPQLQIMLLALARERMQLIYLDSNQLWRLQSMIEFARDMLALQTKQKHPLLQTRDEINQAFTEWSDQDFNAPDE